MLKGRGSRYDGRRTRNQSVLIGSGAQHLKDRLEAKYPTAGLVVLRFPAGAWKDVAINSGKLELFLTPGDVKKS